MRFVLRLLLALLLTAFAASGARAFEIITVPDSVNAINLRAGIDIMPGENGRVQLSTAPGADGIIRRIEVLAEKASTNPNWALFALANESDTQMQRLLVAPFHRLPGSGLIEPDLGSDRIAVLTVNAGIRPERVPDPEADVFEITLDPGATVTFVAELVEGELPELYLWKPDAYRDYVNSFTLFRGTVLGIASLAAVFLTIMFVVKGRGVFPATAALAWAVLAYLLVDFGVLGRLLGVGNGAIQPYRAAAEAALATTLFGFLFIYLNLHRWHLRFLHLALALIAVFLGLFAYSFVQPELAATIARVAMMVLGFLGLFIIVLLALRGYDRAVFLVPTWIIYIAWLFYAWLVISGRVTNDIAQPAVAGGLVLLVMLIGFTTVQHAFSEGQVSIGALSEVERRALALTGCGDFVFDWNVDRDRVQVSEELASRLGVSNPSLRGPIKAWLERIHPEDQDRFRTALDTLVEMRRGKVSLDLRIQAQDASYRAFRLRAKPVLAGDGQVSRVVGTLQDVTSDRAARQRLLHDSVNDSLTGLPNRELFLDRLDSALERSRHGEGAKPAVFFIDIDKFSGVVERLGQAGADSVLLAIARRIARQMRPLDSVARLNADQFGVVLCSEQTADRIAEVSDQLRKAIRAPFTFGERDIAVSASLGVTIFDNGPAQAADVLRDAELAMLYAKRHGGDRIEAYRAAARSIAALAKATEEDLSRAMKNDQIRMYYQPICELTSGRIVGAEALVRWRHPIRGLIGPEEFVPLAERSGQIEELGRLIFEQSAGQLETWQNGGHLPEGFFVSVNLSPRQLAKETLLADMRSYLDEHKSVASHIKLEITEGQLMLNPEHSAYVLANLKAMGLGIALDDFGTGHSSFGYLHRFPADTIKIAADFVRLSGDSGLVHTQAPIMRAIVALAAELDLMVIGEGIETEAERDRLMQLSCHYGQGYLFAEPMDADALHKRLMHNAPARAAAPKPAPTSGAA
ncbi:MAG: sensor domain-containing phosphodiesterase [Alphaproteobacteria bacterium]|nr:sensor domain-containing phosphodiesterase [Alphaproteobacteria bacterium]